MGDMAAWRGSRCLEQKVGLVPTMGALHAGHASLLRRAREECDVVVASIFVNPKQFAATEDLSTYPRRFDDDLSMMTAEGVDLVFAPTTDELYPRGDTFSVEPPAAFSRSAEALSRPTHFGGVATVCTKLFNLCRPDLAFFGQKDAFQCVVIRRLVRDLNFAPLEVRVVPTARDKDGLALSSRNAYLSPEERRAAPIVYAALSAARDRWLSAKEKSSRNPSPTRCSKQDLVETIEKVLKGEPLVTKIEYVSVASFEDMTELLADDDLVALAPRSTAAAAAAVISTAVKVGEVRLIDNILLD